MTIEIPQYGLKAYALLISRYGEKGSFKQSALDWVVSTSMKKKIFSLLLRSGWIRKNDDESYSCKNPYEIMQGLLDFRVPEIIRKAERRYAFTKLSAVEIWSNFSYTQRGREKSPYFIKVLRKDVDYWKNFFNANRIPYYMNNGTTAGEYIILIPVDKVLTEKKDDLFVEPYIETLRFAKENNIYAPAIAEMQNFANDTHG